MQLGFALILVQTISITMYFQTHCVISEIWQYLKAFQMKPYSTKHITFNHYGGHLFIFLDVNILTSTTHKCIITDRSPFRAYLEMLFLLSCLNLYLPQFPFKRETISFIVFSLCWHRRFAWEHTDKNSQRSATPGVCVFYWWNQVSDSSSANEGIKSAVRDQRTIITTSRNGHSK